MTDAERKLWRVLRADQADAFCFRRQHPVGRYVLDFYCPKVKLAIELDGGQHAEAVHEAKDRERDEWLAGKGIVVLRVWNGEVMTNLEGVWETIRREALQLATLSGNEPSRRSTPTPALPLSGGGGTKTGVTLSKRGEKEVDR